MFNLFDEKELKEASGQLQEALGEMVEFHERLKHFLLALKEINNPDVDRIFSEHQVEVTVDRGIECR